MPPNPPDPAWEASLLVPYWRPITLCPALRVSLEKARLFSEATFTPKAGPEKPDFWAWRRIDKMQFEIGTLFHWIYSCQ